MVEEQQAVPVAQEQEAALATAFYLLDTLAGEGLSQTCEDGRTIEADDTVHALCSAFYMEPEVGWYRDLAAELAPVSLPCKSGGGAEASAPDGWTLEQGRPAATAPYACHVLGGRLDETAGEWVMAVVSTPLTAPFTHWWPLPGATIAPTAAQTREAELLAALEPFAEACNISSADDSESLYDTLAAEKLTWRDLRRARAALNARAGA